MQTNRPGCLTGNGIVAAFLTIVMLLGFALFSGNAMFSPGPLNAQPGEQTLGGVSAHAQIADCSACHAGLWPSDRMADHCVACHTGIAAQMMDVAKLHGAITHKSPALACRDCHPEHRGAEAALTELGGNTFPHEALGFSLNGHQRTSANRSFTCDDCHLADITTFAVSACEDCHRQADAAFALAHVISYGTACLDCHDGVDRFGADFSHAGFAFRTEGGHADVACARCHTDARSLADFPQAPQNCHACHNADDPHAGRYGADCAQCHQPTTWQDATFDHNLSTFKLEGEHVEVACEKCHVNSIFKGTATDCYACHQGDDEHKGEFGMDCAACHSPSSWEGANFDHNRSNFPLTGAHVSVRCEQCHSSGQFKGLASTCVACHAEPVEHAGLFGVDCAACHSTSAWTPAEFNGKHTFPLDHGEGGSVSCATCHPVSYSAYTCYGCHEHEEARVRSKHLEEGISNFANCMECHADGREHDD